MNMRSIAAVLASLPWRATSDLGEGQLLVKHSRLVSFERERGHVVVGNGAGHVGVLSRLDRCRLGV